MTGQAQAKDLSLVNQIISNQDSAFAEIYENYFSQVYSYVYYRLSDFYAAEDVTSQIFEKLFCKLSCYQADKAPLSAWIFSIARNTVIDYYRSRRANITSFDLSTEIVDSGPSIEEILVSKEISQSLLMALNSLTKREREIIELKFWSKCSNREISKVLSISESNTGVIIFRALKRLHKTLLSRGIKLHK